MGLISSLSSSLTGMKVAQSQLEIISNNIKVRRNEFTYLFSGLIYCPKCGAKMDGTASVIDKYVYYYYRCKNRYGRGKCAYGKMARESVIEPYLVANLDDLLSKKIAEVDTVEPPEKDNVQAKIKALKSELDNLNYMFSKNRIDIKTYDRLYEKTEAELNALKLDAPKKSNADLHRKVLNSGWRNVYDVMTRENKRAFWRGLIKSIVVDNDANTIAVTFFAIIVSSYCGNIVATVHNFYRNSHLIYESAFCRKVT